MTSVTHHDVEGFVAKGVLRWLIGTGLAVMMAAAVWAAVTDQRLNALEKTSVKPEEVVRLQGSMDLLSAEIKQLRVDIVSLRERP